jgi:hypothetical protein
VDWPALYRSIEKDASLGAMRFRAIFTDGGMVSVVERCIHVLSESFANIIDGASVNTNAWCVQLPQQRQRDVHTGCCGLPPLTGALYLGVSI